MAFLTPLGGRGNDLSPPSGGSGGLIGAGPETLRGGAWNNKQRHARVSARNHNQPDNFNNNIGVRLVVAPDFRLAGKAVTLRSADGQERQRGPVPVACGLHLIKPPGHI
jgi:hypothetical protein